MSEVSPFIADGYTVTGKFRGVARLYPDTILSYRPMTRTEVNAQSTKVLATDDPASQEKVATAALKKHILAWSLKLKDGSAAPIDEKHLSMLQPAQFDRYYRAIMGRQGPDEILENEDALDEDAGKN